MARSLPIAEPSRVIDLESLLRLDAGGHLEGFVGERAPAVTEKGMAAMVGLVLGEAMSIGQPFLI